MHYYKKNIGDYHKKAGRLTMLQHGAYTLLMDACYDREQFPTKDMAIDWLWASTPDEVAAIEFVLGKFFILEGDIYIQKRIQQEIEKYKENSKINKRIAIERESKKREKSTNRERTVNEPPPNQEPRTKNQEPLKDNKSLDQSEIDQCFDFFWSSGIRKVNKKKTIPLFGKYLKDNHNPGGPTIYDLTAILIDDVKARIKANQLGFSEMHPTTYLNGERWNDEIKANTNEENRRASKPENSLERFTRKIRADIAAE